ncbi:DUF4198 domain-containing protein [Cupriavidus gilardii]|uniref:DUF4198 domain-containing protein n=1 Tax=Cupriavidus gilardii TaxID=82541 RepID=UPI001EE61F88|nr:DUF4198 domain-containing protein [Cupriavidus gilardii]MCG5260418.1 DUF4198 domain-containing protein [Cupriavidus gilardii]MDF9428268.1 DUF4198 domain-containing protein [Cupriavidus gilardii]
MKLSASLAFALTAFATAAHAHQIWIEQAPGGNASVRFGEFAENLREVSPGTLDKLGVPSAALISARGEQAADGVKTADGFALPFKASRGDAIVAQAPHYAFYPFKRGDQQLTGWYFPAARLVTDFAPQAPKLALDVVPAGKAGQLQVFFRGKPLPKAKVALVTQSGWAKEKQTDDQGKVAFDMPWQGVYVAEVSHQDETPGERQGPGGPERYHRVDYVSTLTFVKPDGLPAVPAAPAPAAKKAGH